MTHDQTEAMAMSDRIILINQGVIQQAGSPMEIYNRPVNPFVADFLGKVDFARGRVQDGQLAIHGTDQSVRCDADLRGDVILAARPERITLSSEAGELKGILENQYYLGDVNDCRVRVGKTIFRVIAPPESFLDMAPGDEVWLTFRVKMVFPDDGSLDEKLKIRT